MGKFKRCQRCRNDYPGLVCEVVREILCKHCKNYSNLDPVREMDLQHIKKDEEERLKRAS